MGIHIEVVNPNRSYFAGQVVEGRVVVNNAKPDKVNEITLKLEGTGRVCWSEQEYYTVYVTQRDSNGHMRNVAQRRTRTVTYSADETYVAYRTTLAGDGQNSTIIPQGNFIYPFQFVLPTNIPSSFNSKIGQVSYLLKGEIKRALFKFNDRAKLPFTVNGLFDLNLEPGANLPQECSAGKGSNCCACRKGNINFKMSLPTRSGFVPGEHLDFQTEILNSSNKKVTGSKAYLQQVAKFYVQGKSKTMTKTICEIRGPSVDKGDFEPWAAHLVIPAVPPTRLGAANCRIIDVQYFVNFELNISGLSSSLTGKFPVMIGTIPLRATFEHFRPAGFIIPAMPMPQVQPDIGLGFKSPRAEEDPTLPAAYDEKPGSSSTSNGSAPSAPIFSDYPDLPPPTYAEAVGAEGFTWVPETTEAAQTDNSEPSAPSIDNFVPNYITYNRHV